mgnify:CR=1 FL=1
MISCTPVSLRGRMEPLSLTCAKGGLRESSDGRAGSRPLPRARLHGVQEGALGWECQSGGLCTCVCMHVYVYACACVALPVRRALCCAMCYAYGLLWLTKRLSSGRLVCVISAMGVLASGSLRRVTTRVRLRRRRRLRLRRSGQGRGRCEVAADRSFRRFRSISSSATCSSRKESSASAWSSM